MGLIRIASVNNTISREPDPGKDGDEGTNYLGVAMLKLAAMMATGMNSGSNIGFVKYGETAYRGGVIRKDGIYTVYAGFSGGTEDQDVDIAQFGMELLFADKD